MKFNPWTITVNINTHGRIHSVLLFLQRESFSVFSRPDDSPTLSVYILSPNLPNEAQTLMFYFYMFVCLLVSLKLTDFPVFALWCGHMSPWFNITAPHCESRRAPVVSWISLEKWNLHFVSVSVGWTCKFNGGRWALSCKSWSEDEAEQVFSGPRRHVTAPLHEANSFLLVNSSYADTSHICHFG